MARLLTLAPFFALVASALAPAAPVPTHLFPKDPPPYFPTKVGAKWVYDDEGEKVTLVVARAERKGRVTRVRVELVRGDGGTQHVETVDVGPGGLSEVESFYRKWDPPVPRLRLPHKPGAEWKASLVLDGEDRGGETMTAGGVEDVKVPAGPFRCLRVETVHDGPKGRRLVHWYAPGVGPVRVSYRAGSTRDLVSFDPGKD